MKLLKLLKLLWFNWRNCCEFSLSNFGKIIEIAVSFLLWNCWNWWNCRDFFEEIAVSFFSQIKLINVLCLIFVLLWLIRSAFSSESWLVKISVEQLHFLTLRSFLMLYDWTFLRIPVLECGVVFCSTKLHRILRRLWRLWDIIMKWKRNYLCIELWIFFG